MKFWNVLIFPLLFACSREQQIFQYKKVFEMERWAQSDSIFIHFTPKKHYDSVKIKIGLQYFTDIEFDILYMSLRISNDDNMERLVAFDINFKTEPTGNIHNLSKLKTLEFTAVSRLSLVKNLRYTFTLMHHMPLPFIDRVRSIELTIYTY